MLFTSDKKQKAMTTPADNLYREKKGLSVDYCYIGNGITEGKLQ